MGSDIDTTSTPGKLQVREAQQLLEDYCELLLKSPEITHSEDGLLELYSNSDCCNFHRLLKRAHATLTTRGSRIKVISTGKVLSQNWFMDVIEQFNLIVPDMFKARFKIQ